MWRIFAVALLAVSPGFGTKPEGQLSGTIRDASNLVMTNASITAVNEQTGIRRHARSGSSGSYMIASLPAGPYKLVVRKSGFQPVSRFDIEVAEGHSVRVDFTLTIAAMAQSVTVKDRGLPPDKTAGAREVTLKRDLIGNLPLSGRGLLGLIELAPGTVITPASKGEAGQFSANGERANANYLTVDGVSANSGVSGGGLPGQFPGSTLPRMTAFGGLQDLASLDEIEQVTVETSNFAPEYGRMPGAQVMVTTRGGSNEFHGSAFFAGRNEALDANDWFANSFGLSRPRFRMSDFGGSLGGPVLRNRAFFFVSYEGMRLTQPYVLQMPVPSLASRSSAPAALRPLLAAFPRPNGGDLGGGISELIAASALPSRLDIGSARLDQIVTPGIRLFARYSQAPSLTESGYSQMDNLQFGERNITAGLSGIRETSFTYDARINLGFSESDAVWNSTGAGGAMPLDLSSVVAGFNPSFSALTINGMGQLVTGQGGHSAERQVEFLGSAGIKIGTHEIRVGGDFQRLTPARRPPNTSVTLTYPSLGDLLSNQLYWLTYAQSDEVTSQLDGISLYAQDTWRIGPRVTVTYGTRWELDPAPATRYRHPVYTPDGSLTFADAGAPVWRTRYNNFAPRAGVAYRLTESGNAVLRGGFGWYYDAGFGAATDELNGGPYNSWQIELGSRVPLVIGAREPGRAHPEMFGPPTGLAPVTPPSLAYGFASDLKLPHSLAWNVSLEKSWNANGVASLAYVGSSGRDLLRREALVRPLFQVAQAEFATNDAASNCQSLQLQYRRDFSHRLAGTVSYAWAHSIDTGSWDSALFLVSQAIGARQDRGASSFDARHTFTAAFSYEAPGTNGLGLLDRLSRGWGFDGIFHARTGFPVDVLTAETVNGLDFANVTRPDLVGGQPVWIADTSVPGGRRLNPAAFALPYNRQGTLGRNAIRGLGMSQLDASVRREFALGGERALRLRVDAFNALNHSSFADPERFLTSPLFGQSMSMLNLMLGTGSPHSGLTPAFQTGGPRSLEVSLRFRF